jgi:hypothetical protein
MATQIRQKIIVKEINLEDGTWLSDFAAVKEATHAHFETLYRKEEEANPSFVQEMLSHNPPLVTL